MANVKGKPTGHYAYFNPIEGKSGYYSAYMGYGFDPATVWRVPGSYKSGKVSDTSGFGHNKSTGASWQYQLNKGVDDRDAWWKDREALDLAAFGSADGRASWEDLIAESDISADDWAWDPDHEPMEIPPFDESPDLGIPPPGGDWQQHENGRWFKTELIGGSLWSPSAYNKTTWWDELSDEDKQGIYSAVPEQDLGTEQRRFSDEPNQTKEEYFGGDVNKSAKELGITEQEFNLGKEQGIFKPGSNYNDPYFDQSYTNLGAAFLKGKNPNNLGSILRDQINTTLPQSDHVPTVTTQTGTLEGAFGNNSNQSGSGGRLGIPLNKVGEQLKQDLLWNFGRGVLGVQAPAPDINTDIAAAQKRQANLDDKLGFGIARHTDRPNTDRWDSILNPGVNVASAGDLTGLVNQPGSLANDVKWAGEGIFNTGYDVAHEYHKPDSFSKHKGIPAVIQQEELGMPPKTDRWWKKTHPGGKEGWLQEHNKYTGEHLSFNPGSLPTFTGTGRKNYGKNLTGISSSLLAKSSGGGTSAKKLNKQDLYTTFGHTA